MTGKKVVPIDRDERRRLAIEQLRTKKAELRLPLSKEGTQKLVHELEVHQIELEMQNQELLQARFDEGEALKKYTDLYDFAPIGYLTLDSVGTIHAVNLSGAAMLGIERSRLVGLRLGLLVDSGDRLFFSDFLEKVFSSQEKQSCEVTLSREERHPLFVQIVAITEASSNECRIAVIDITERRAAEEERKRTEEALRKSEQKFSRIFDSVPALIGICSLREGRFVDVNQASLQTLGYQRDEIVGKTAQELGLWENEAERVTLMRDFKEQGSMKNKEIRFKAKSGKILTGLCSAELIDLDEERYMLILVRDITSRKAAEEEIKRLNVALRARAAELEDVNRELEAFNYSVAHDLRNPLNVINGYCQAIKDVCSDKLSMPCRRYIQEIDDGTLRMNRLIEALLDFSKLTHIELNREQVDLSSMATEIAGELKGTEAERRVEFRIADGIAGKGDATLLQVVLTNLLGNAWKYTCQREDAVIEFGMKVIAGQPTFFVRDNGIGFANADVEKIFIPFQRLPGAEECRGFGIGLATVERIIKRHGGSVCAEGIPGKGATVYFTIGAQRHEDSDSGR
jgi:PAS domain S-box-containing protein